MDHSKACQVESEGLGVMSWLADDESNTYSSASPQMPVKNIAFEMKGNRRVNQTTKKTSRQKRVRNKEKPPKLSSTQPIDSNIAVENGPDDDSCWPHFSDEDYIVFCFREDGAFDVVKDGKPEASSRFDCTSRSPRSINRKLNYGDGDKTEVERSSSGEKLNRHESGFCLKNDGDVLMISDQKDEEEECIYLDAESPTNSTRRRRQMKEVEGRGVASVESSESNQSDGSTGSFAFPVLGLEWMGSPVRMPKSEGLQLRKHKARCVGFQCFRV